MITFSQLGQLGRLGNQLFQYAALFSLAKHRGYEYGIPNLENSEWHGQKCLLREFDLTAQIIDTRPSKVYMEPDPWNYDPNFFRLQDNIDLYGYFQSTFYFGDLVKEIREELTPSEKHLSRSKEWRKTLGERPVVSVHLRRGDNCDWTDNEEAKQTAYGPSEELDPNSFMGKYLKNAFDVFSDLEDPLFVIFTGGSRSGDDTWDIEWCKRQFTGDEFFVASSNDELSDFCNIMSCDHNIISPISSFGWWAAFLNKNESKQVVAPENYHPGSDVKSRPMFYPEEFTLV